MTDLVIDASVAVKWVIDEPGTKEALSLLRHRLYAPDLLVAECANILWKKVRRKEQTSEEAGFATRLLQQADIELAPMRPLLEPATRLAIGLDYPAHDCTYLALAENMSCNLVTADQRPITKGPPDGYKSKVLALAASALP